MLLNVTVFLLSNVKSRAAQFSLISDKRQTSNTYRESVSQGNRYVRLIMKNPSVVYPCASRVIQANLKRETNDAIQLFYFTNWMMARI